MTRGTWNLSGLHAVKRQQDTEGCLSVLGWLLIGALALAVGGWIEWRMRVDSVKDAIREIEAEKSPKNLERIE